MRGVARVPANLCLTCEEKTLEKSAEQPDVVRKGVSYKFCE